MYAVAAAVVRMIVIISIIIKHDEGVGSRHEMPRPHALICVYHTRNGSSNGFCGTSFSLLKYILCRV